MTFAYDSGSVESAHRTRCLPSSQISPGRVIVATFSSHVHRMQQIFTAAEKYGRKVALVGRSMLTVFAAANDDVLAHVKVVDLLKSLPRVGEKRAAAVMERLDIAPNRRIRGLGRHQIAGLKAEFK